MENTPPFLDSSVLHSHWSRSNEDPLSLVERIIVLKYFHGVATQAILCHKEPARASKTPTRAFGTQKEQRVFLACSTLVLMA